MFWFRRHKAALGVAAMGACYAAALVTLLVFIHRLATQGGGC